MSTMIQPAIEIRVEDLTGAAIAEFLSEHLRCLAEVSPPESRHALNLEEPAQTGSHFLERFW